MEVGADPNRDSGEGGVTRGAEQSVRLYTLRHYRTKLQSRYDTAMKSVALFTFPGSWTSNKELEWKDGQLSELRNQ